MKPYVLTFGLTINPSSMNYHELREFGLSLCNNGSNHLDSWASDAGRALAVQIQQNEVMQVALLCDTIVPALAGSGHIFPRMMPLSYD